MSRDMTVYLSALHVWPIYNSLGISRSLSIVDHTYVFTILIVQIHLSETTVKASGYLHGGHGEEKMSTVATFSIVKYSAVSFSVSSKLLSKRKKAWQPFQFKFTVIYDSTNSEI